MFFLALLAVLAAPDAIAGRSMEGWVADLDAEDRIVQARAAKTLGAFGMASVEPLREALDHDTPAVRYWAAYHLGRLTADDKETVAALKKQWKDESNEAVRLAFAYALVQVDGGQPYLDSLSEKLQHPTRGVACSAAELLGLLGEKAAPAVPALKKAYAANEPGGKGDYHLGGAAQNALRQIDSAE